MKNFKLFFTVCVFVLLLGGLLSAETIFKAVETGDLAKTKAMITKDPGLLKARDTDKNTPLHGAAGAGHDPVVSFLLEKGADIDDGNYMKYTPLHLAAKNGHETTVKLLVEKGADLNAKSSRGRVPAFVTIVSVGKENIIRYLIEKGTDINTRDNSGRSLLARANERKFPRIVDLLLDEGVKLPTKQRDVINLLYMAAHADQPRLFKLLLSKNKAVDLKKYGHNLLLNAVESGAVKMTQLLLTKGYDVNKPSYYGNTALHLAAKGGHTEIIQLLTGAGAEIDKPNAVGQTPFHIAQEYERKEAVQLLVKKGAKQGPPQFPKLTGPYLGQKPPGTEPEVFALGIVSIEVLEHSPPVFTKDGKEVYWATDFPMKIMTMKLVDGRWTAPKTTSFHSPFGDSEPALSFDDKKLFFLSTRSEDGTKKINKENVWFVERTSSGWSEPKLLPKAVNDHKMHWSISLDREDALYFASEHGSGYGGKDIYKAEFKDGRYREPVNLGPEINSKLVATTPFIAPDQSYLIYSIKDHPEGKGSLDLFISFRDKDGKWSKPKNLGPTVNTAAHELCPVVTPDGKYLFFLRQMDMFWVDASIIKELTPKAK